MPPQLEKNHVVPTAWQDEALARDGVSRDWLLRASASFCGKLSRTAPRRGAGEPEDPRNPGVKNGGGGRAAGQEEPLSESLGASRGEAGAP